jgi:hypothetical protein
MNYLRDVDFWLKAGPTLAALIGPLLIYLWLGRVMAKYQSERSKEIESYKAILSKELENYKGDISKELEIHKLQIQSSFQTRFYEFQTRYGWLHQRKAEAIEKLFMLAARVQNDLQIWISSSQVLRNQTEDEFHKEAEAHFQEMINFFDEKRIYFDKETSGAVLGIVETTNAVYDQHRGGLRHFKAPPELEEALKQTAASLIDHLGVLMSFLDYRFRKLLEAEMPSHQGEEG